MRLRLIFALVLSALGASAILFFASPANAQNFTAVSGTIVDPNGLPYSNCSITAELVPAGTNPTIGGAAIGGLNRGSCDLNGTFSMTLGSNAVIVPGATQWKFTVNEVPGIAPPAGFGPQSFSTTLTISGASQDISASLAVPALALARSGAAGPTAGVTAYDPALRVGAAGIGSNWKQVTNAVGVAGGLFVGSTAGLNSAFWAANSFSPEQFAEAKITGLNGTTDLVGVANMMQPTGANFYDCVENTTTILLRKVVNGVPSTLVSTPSTGAFFDRIRLEVWPTGNIICSKNGAPILTFQDQTFVSGSPGISITGTVASENDWLGSNLLNWNCAQFSPLTVNANTTADQNGFSCTVPPFSLIFPGENLKMLLAGVYSTPAASTSAITVKIKLCSVAGCGSGTVLTLLSFTTPALGTIQVTNNPFNVLGFSMPAPGSIGNAASFEAHGNFTIDLSAAATAAASIFPDNNTATIGPIDQSHPIFLQTTIAFSVASASNSATMRQMFLETVKAAL